MVRSFQTRSSLILSVKSFHSFCVKHSLLASYYLKERGIHRSNALATTRGFWDSWNVLTIYCWIIWLSGLHRSDHGKKWLDTLDWRRYSVWNERHNTKQFLPLVGSETLVDITEVEEVVEFSEKRGRDGVMLLMGYIYVGKKEQDN